MSEKYLNNSESLSTKSLNTICNHKQVIENTNSDLLSILNMKDSGIIGYLRIVLQREPTEEEVKLIKNNAHMIMSAFQKGNITDFLYKLLSDTSISNIINEERYIILLKRVLLDYFDDI